MNARTAEDVADDVVAHLMTATGYRPDAVVRAKVVRAITDRAPISPEAVLERFVRNDRDVTNALLEAISVGETYFFRQTAHFDSLAADVLPKLSTRSHVRAWCAGCATGEEAYSVAACLRANLRPGTRIEVIGTDIVERNVRAATAGVYGVWSTREAGPPLYRASSPLGDGRVTIDAELRTITSFLCHNLLSPPPAMESHAGPFGPFDIVFCRNVLIYFSLEATRTALQHMVASLAKGGVIAFGPLDVSATPPGLERLGAPEGNMFVRTNARSDRPRSWSAVPVAPPLREEPPARERQPSLSPGLRGPAVGDHVRALEAIDNGRHDVAEDILVDLHRSTPDYVPGIFELALLHVRSSRADQASALMRELLRKTEQLAPDDSLPGPEELTVSYYRIAAEAYLGESGSEA